MEDEEIVKFALKILDDDKTQKKLSKITPKDFVKCKKKINDKKQRVSQEDER